jgi:hypothetical protein
MATPNDARSWGVDYIPAPEGITTLITERPDLLRKLLLSKLYYSAEGISTAISDEMYYVKRGMCRKTAEKRIRARMAEIQEILMLLGQTGWR